MSTAPPTRPRFQFDCLLHRTADSCSPGPPLATHSVQEAAEVIAEAELSELLFGTWTNAASGSSASVAEGANTPNMASHDEVAVGTWSSTRKADSAASGSRRKGVESFDAWLKVADIPPLTPSGTYAPPKRVSSRGRGRGRGGRGRGGGPRLTPRQLSVQTAAQAAINRVNGVDSAIAYAREVQRSQGPRKELVPTGPGHENAVREVQYKAFGSVPREFPKALVTALLEKRSAARLRKRFTEADRLQKRIERLGVKLDDRRRTWSVIKGWRNMQLKEAGKVLASAPGGKDAATS